MESQVKIPNGDEMITVKLTVKEALALSGAKFNESKLAVDARKKLKESLEEQTKETVH